MIHHGSGDPCFPASPRQAGESIPPPADGYFSGMTKISTLSLRSIAPALGLVAFSAQAQFITLTDPWGNDVTNGNIQFSCDANPTPPAVELDVNCLLNTSSPKVVNMRRYELQIPAETTINYYCWGECYAPDTSGDHPVWGAPDVNTLYPAEVFVGFHAYYMPMGVVGSACFRYVWFDDGNPTDSVFVDICFNATPVGMEEHADAALKFNAYPVPSTTGNVELSFDAPRAGQQVYVELHDALGQTIATERIRTGQQRLVLGEGRLAPGLVFATLRVDGQAKATRRLVIAGH